METHHVEMNRVLSDVRAHTKWAARLSFGGVW